MDPFERLEKYKDEDLDRVVLLIKNGTIKCGRYSQLVKVKRSEIMKGKEFFGDDTSGKRKA